MDNAIQSVKTQERIQEAFWQLYEKKSMQKITTTDIAKLACIHRNTFYRYYTSIYDLRDSLEQQLVELLVPYADEQMVNRQLSTKNVFLDILKTHKKRFMLAVQKDGPGFSEKYKTMLFPILRKNFDETSGQAMDDFMIDYILSGSIALIVRFFQSPDDQDIDDLAARIIDYFNRVYTKQQ